MVATLLFMFMPKGLNSPQSTSLDPRFTGTGTADINHVVLTIAAADSATIREDRTLYITTTTLRTDHGKKILIIFILTIHVSIRDFVVQI